MLDSIVRVFQNPWDHRIPNDEFAEIFERVGNSRADHVEKMNERGEWPRNSLGLAFLNPAAPLWQPTSETLLATIAIGPEGERFIVNAIAKASYHRDHGLPGGYGVYVDTTMSIDGDFAYGFSTKVDGLIAAASGQSEIQDACEAAHAAASLLYFLRSAHAEWMEAQQSHPHWYCNLDAPLEVYTAMAGQSPIYQSGAS